MSATIGPYTIERRLAEGGMGEVFLARHRTSEGLERRVVLKRVVQSDDLDDDSVAMLLDESRLMASLTHPYIAQVYDLGRDGDAFYLAMEYVRGPTLFKLQQAAKARGDQGVPEGEAVFIALAVAEALSYAHERLDARGKPLGIVHRDLSPANVLVTFDGSPKLIDFGIAKAASRLAQTTVGHVKGTHGYIAPELLMGLQADARADVFALGVLLYEMLFLAHPFEGKHLGERLQRMNDGRYERPRDRRPGFPATLEKVIEQCLLPSRDARPETMRHVVDALAGHLAARRLAPTMEEVSTWVLALIPDPEPRAPRKPRPRLQLPAAIGELLLDAPPVEHTLVDRATKRPGPPRREDPDVTRPARAAPLPVMTPAPEKGRPSTWLLLAVGVGGIAFAAAAVYAARHFLVGH